MSGKTKHTPGPWEARRDPCHFDTLSSVVGGCPKPGRLQWTLMVEVGGHAAGKEQEANTHLIAAAPDLLEALEAVLEELREDAETIEEEFGMTSPKPTFSDMLQKGEYPGAAKAIKAIAKAKGETK